MRIFLVALICYSAPLATGIRASFPNFSLLDEFGHPLESPFQGIRPNLKIVGSKTVLDVKPAAPCPRQIREKLAPRATLVDRIRSWFTITVVHAQNCPNCFPQSDYCTGLNMWPEPVPCFEGCGGGLYNHYISNPPLGPAWQGWCWSGNLTCGTCQCEERSCYNG
jgi:hypothetical protein